ncbi:hypothetical protein [Chryseobacterium sp. JUb7]|uniref:hypothetical protein n=1 Tax=Chryseobacterium sp. JUb7 TaxID=2940599 RepID=UPI0021686CD6|nr:hypothetical protein [Chryseobacterium sp. JUb7]MCS3530804.1 hypothetical protein [Chryseobacterium sp. JUb7]
MNKKIKNAVFAGGMSFVLALNFLMPNVTKAQGIAYANQTQSSNTSREALPPGSQVSYVAIAAVFLVVATLKGLQVAEGESISNLNNLD